MILGPVYKIESTGSTMEMLKGNASQFVSLIDGYAGGESEEEFRSAIGQLMLVLGEEQPFLGAKF